MKVSPALRQFLVYLFTNLVSMGVLLGIIPHDAADKIVNYLVDGTFGLLMILVTYRYFKHLLEVEKHHLTGFLHRKVDEENVHGKGN